MLDFNHAFESADSLSNISLLVWNVNETLKEAVKRFFSQDVLKDKLNLAEMYTDAEPDDTYWKFAIKQLENVIYD